MSFFRGNHLREALKATGLQIALVAMILRALLPSGWMPMASASGATLTICTINGPVQISLDAQGHPQDQKPQQDDDRHHMLCHFACAGTVFAGQTLASIEAPSTQRESRRPPRNVDATVSRARYGPQAARAPPNFV